MSVSITVAIPAYNCEETLQRAIDSVLAQTYRDYELLIVNDCSTDGTAEILSAQSDPRIRVLHHKENGGEAAARNTLFENARGDLLAFLDSDDVWYPEKLAAQVKTYPGLGGSLTASFTGLDVYNVVDETTSIKAHKPVDDPVAYLLSNCELGAGTSMMIPVTAFEVVGPYDTELRRRTDHDWILRFVAGGGQLFFVPGEPLGKVFKFPVTNAVPSETSTRHFIDKHEDIYARYPKAVANAAKGNLWLGVAVQYAACRDVWNVLRMLARGFRYAPVRAVKIALLLLDRAFGAPVFRLLKAFSRSRSRAVRTPEGAG